MKRHWDEHGLGERWPLTHDEFELLRNRTDRSRIGFAVLLKFFQVDGRFPNERREVPGAALDYVAAQVAVSPEKFSEYEFGGRSCERDRAQIRTFLGFRRVMVRWKTRRNCRNGVSMRSSRLTTSRTTLDKLHLSGAVETESSPRPCSNNDLETPTRVAGARFEGLWKSGPPDGGS